MSSCDQHLDCFECIAWWYVEHSLINIWHLPSKMVMDRVKQIDNAASSVASTISWFINILRPRQNGRHFPDGIFKWISLNEDVWISINISLKFVSRGPINNIPTLVQVMAWRRPGGKPLSEPMMVRLPTHMCVTLPQSVKSLSKNTVAANTVGVINQDINLFHLSICYIKVCHWYVTWTIYTYQIKMLFFVIYKYSILALILFY